MQYSYNQNKEGVFLANAKDLNASFKDLGMVCAAIRYQSTPRAIAILDSVIEGRRPILYAKHNKHMGARHELGGRKGRWPMKCAAIVKKVLVNAMANATNKDMDPEHMYVVHAAANKTLIARRLPPRGALFVTGGPSGQVPARHSDLEFSRVEIGVALLDEQRMSQNMIDNIKRAERRAPKPSKKEEKKAPGKEKKSILTKVAKPEQKAELPAVQKKEEPKPPAKAPEQKPAAPMTQPQVNQ